MKISFLKDTETHMRGLTQVMRMSLSSDYDNVFHFICVPEHAIAAAADTSTNSIVLVNTHHRDVMDDETNKTDKTTQKIFLSPAI